MSSSSPSPVTGPLTIASIPTPPRPGGSSPLRDYLRNPGAAVHTVLNAVRTWALTWGPVAGPALAALVTAVLVGRWCWRRRRRTRLARDARTVTVLAPPTVDPAGAQTLFANLVGMLRPGWARWLHGQPHLAFEYLFTQTGLTLRLWLPGSLHPWQ